MATEERRLSVSSLSGIHPMTRPFLKAVYEGDLVKVSSMVDNDGIPVDVCNTAGLQAIHFAAKTGDAEMTSELIKHGAMINATSARGNTPLHIAALIGNREVVKLLLHLRASVNAISECNEDQFTPLYMASQIGHQEIVTLLLAHGADPTIATKNGSTPRDVALQQGHHAVAELLEEYQRRLEQLANQKTTDAGGTPPDGTAAPTAEGGFGDRPTTERRTHRHPPAVYNRDVIPSPKKSPMKRAVLAAAARGATALQNVA